MKEGISISDPSEVFREKPVITPLDVKPELKGTEKEYQLHAYIDDEVIESLHKDINSFFNQEGKYHLSQRESPGWRQFADELANKKGRYEPFHNEAEEFLVEAFTSIPTIVEILRKKAIDKIENVTDNVALIEWQQAVVKMIQRLDMLKGGKAIIECFWDYWTKICGKRLNEEQANERRAGIIGILALGRILDQLGYDCYFAKPSQDAKEAIDIFIVDRINGVKKGIIAAQSKGESAGILNISINPVRPFELVRGQFPTKEQSDRFRLLTFSQEYDKIWRSQGVNGGVHPAWIIVSGIGRSSLQQEVDFSTGEVGAGGLRSLGPDTIKARLEKLFGQGGQI